MLRPCVCVCVCVCLKTYISFFACAQVPPECVYVCMHLPMYSNMCRHRGQSNPGYVSGFSQGVSTGLLYLSAIWPPSRARASTRCSINHELANMSRSIGSKTACMPCPSGFISRDSRGWGGARGGGCQPQACFQQSRQKTQRVRDGGRSGGDGLGIRV